MKIKIENNISNIFRYTKCHKCLSMIINIMSITLFKIGDRIAKLFAYMTA